MNQGLRWVRLMGEEFCENPENVPTNGKKRLTVQKRLVHGPPVLKKVWQIPKLLVADKSL
jgi:hypothetical protein